VIELVSRVEHAIRTHGLIGKGQTVLVAVSGGRDSMLLLHLLAVLTEEHKWRLVVAHFNHQLRGRSADADERLVRATARALGLHCRVGRGDVRAKSRREGVSLEMAARELRHRFLGRVAAKIGASVIAMAHHADDQVELGLLRLLRGAGGQGMGGMTWSGPALFAKGVRVVRPLLGVARADIERAAARARIRFREDASNRDESIPRNRVRHRLRRRLFGEDSGTAIRKAMDIAASESDFAERAACEWLGAGRRAHFGMLHVAVQRQVVRLQLLALGVASGYELIERLRLFPDEVTTAPGGQGLVCRPDGTVEAKASRAFQSAQVRVDLSKGSEARFSNLQIQCSCQPAPRQFRRPQPRPGREVFDADRVGRTIVLRLWRPGDRFQPIGMPAAVKLQDLFTNARIPAGERRRRVLACTAEGAIFWVEGLRIGESFKVTSDSRRRLVWRWRRDQSPKEPHKAVARGWGA
jgi:tRNA(Ile)-lysidine synthase